MRDQQLDPLNDDLAREIEHALAVEPSPEFQARVRLRVAQAPPLADAGFGWWRSMAMSAAAFVVIVIGVVGWQLMQSGERRDAGPTVANDDHRVAPPVQESIPPAPVADRRGASQPVVPAVGPKDDRRTRARLSVEPPIQVIDTRRSPTDPFSDVLVSASEVRAVRQITALLSPEDVLKAPPPSPSSTPEGINELVIAPITVAPIQLRPIEGEAE